jgi:hypothetical protein
VPLFLARIVIFALLLVLRPLFGLTVWEPDLRAIDQNRPLGVRFVLDVADAPTLDFFLGQGHDGLSGTGSTASSRRSTALTGRIWPMARLMVALLSTSKPPCSAAKSVMNSCVR